MFLQIHTLTSYPASLLNRDDAGLAKRIPFGNALRLRVSSQCLKRHWRQSLVKDKELSKLPDGHRSRSFFTRIVLPRAVEAGVPEDIARTLIEPLAQALIEGGVREGGNLSQPVLFGVREADYFVSLLREASSQSDPVRALTDRIRSRAERDNFRAMRKSALGMEGLTAALFGRMVTSDLLARVDAPVHVAHAFTVHAAHTEMDYFTVVDDLSREEETGAAHANQTELGAGVFYGYVVVDVPLLVSNLTGRPQHEWQQASEDERQLTRRVLAGLIEVIARQSPGAKLGSTAPYAYADFVLLEIGAVQPRSLANAYLAALPTRHLSGDLRQEAIQRLADYLGRLDEMYGSDQSRRLLASIFDPPAPLPERQPLSQAIQGALDALWHP